MQKNYKKEIIPLFTKFIQESKNGRRIQKNGKKISKSSIENYQCVLKYLVLLNNKSNSPLAISSKIKPNRQEYIKEKKYWANFFMQYKKEMYSNGCSDNYVGMCIKILKAFFKYLEVEKHFPVTGFYSQFYPPQFETPVLVLDQEKLRFLISDKTFDNSLLPYLKVSKDLFVVGCTIGLRFSDLKALKKTNIEIIEGSTYIITTSKKTNTPTRIKIPPYVEDIIKCYTKGKNILPSMSLQAFNENIKKIGELAGWVNIIGKERGINGQKKEIKTPKGKAYRFCDLLSSHIMRKTAITTLLILGMPEPLVRKISGHAPNSTEFYKYVKYSESFLDSETDKVFSKLLR